MRRFFQFGLPTLFFFVAILAVALAWWKDHQDLETKVQNLKNELRDAELLRHWFIASARDDATVFSVTGGEIGSSWESRAGKAASPRAKAYDELLMLDTTKSFPPDDDFCFALSPEARSILLKRLADSDPQVRARAASTFASSRDSAKDNVAVLASALADEDRDVRWNILYALARVARNLGPAEVSAVEHVFQGEKSSMAVFAARVLRERDPKTDIVPRLAELLCAPDDEMRNQAARLLWEISVESPSADFSAVHVAVLKMLDDASAEVRHFAITQMAQFVPPQEAIPILRRAFRDESDERKKREIARVLYGTERSQHEIDSAAAASSTSPER